MKRAFAEIHLDVLTSNIQRVQHACRNGAQVMGVIKADAYGHGAVTVARTLKAQGVKLFAVAWLAEAVELRQHGITDPILILSQPQRHYIPQLVAVDVIQTVYDLDFARELNAAAAGKKIKVHVKVDTGMRRIGVAPDAAVDLIRALQALPNIEVAGLFTHFACADIPQHPLNKQQIDTFQSVQADVTNCCGRPRYIHAANSAAIEHFPEVHFDLVRAGISLYRGVMAFKSQVMFVKEVPTGSSVSYGANFVTQRPTKVATISAGYADGLPRALSSKGRVLIQGKSVPIIGNVCMDMCMVDVTGTDVVVGDEVVLIGKQGDQEITAQEVANLTGTIDYEIMCGISKRVPRIYK
jgi:alanine racemase